MLRTILTSVLSVGLWAAAVQPSHAIQAFTSNDLAGNQSYNLYLGNDFDVLSPITISALGAFDAGGDGLAGTITVSIVDLSDLSVLETLAIDSGTLMGGYRYVDLGTALDLAVGSYSVLAVGFSATDQNGNENVSDINNVGNDGAGLIDFVDSRFGAYFPSFTTVGTFPCSGSAETCFAAGSFLYDATDVPVPASLGLIAAGIAGVGLIRRKRAAA